MHGDRLGDRAKEYFSASEYRRVPNVCYFYEHSTTGRDGRPQRYSVKELADIIDEHNERADTNSFSAIASRHTVDGIMPESMEPKVLGFAGPYRLGMVGYDNPKYAVFADEHHLKSEAATLAKKKRRSVEVNRFKDGRRPYFDPIAALGAESPRLALPVARYSVADDADVERYEFMSPSVVSGSNTFIPSAEPFKERHSTEHQNVDMNPQTGDQDAMIQNIVKAILATPEMQFVRSQMNAGQGGQPQSDPSQSQPQASPQGGQGDANAFGGGAGMGAPDMNKPQRYAATDDADRELVERFSQLQDEHAELAEKYQQMATVNAANMETMGRMKQAVVQLEQRAVDADRTLKIKELYQQYPHFIDVNEELGTCLYSHGSDMGAEAFDKHVSMLDRLAKKSSPTTQMLPGGDNAPSDTEKYSADFTQQVVERYTLEANRGNILKYEDVEALVREGK